MTTSTTVRISSGFSESERETAARLYYAAFGQKLRTVMGQGQRAERFFVRVLDPSHAISAIGPDGTLLGFAGFKTENGSFAGGDLHDLAAVYGWLGTLWRAPLLALLLRSVTPEQLLMDGIAVADEARGLGIGTRLLEAIIEEARARGLTAVRLDVIDTNPRARSLYERFGFEPQSTIHLGPFKYLFGFRSATTMVFRIAA